MGQRRILPDRRPCETFNLRFEQQEFAVTIGYYGDGSVGEIFINMSRRAGTSMDSITRDGAVVVSLALQHGVPLTTISHALTKNADGSPSAVIGAVVNQLVKQ